MKNTLIILSIFALFAISVTEAKGGSICPRAGYFQDILDCKSYNLCYMDRESGIMNSIHFTCGEGKAYDSVNGYCSRDAFKNGCA